jgi:hypothetical protein
MRLPKQTLRQYTALQQGLHAGRFKSCNRNDELLAARSGIFTQGFDGR